MTATWMVNVGGRAYGPYTDAQMAAYAAEGRLAPQSLVAREGEIEFRLAGEDSALADLFANGDQVRAAVSAWLLDEPNAEVMAALAGRVPGGPVQNIEEIASDPHVQAREMIVEVEQPGTDRTVGIAGSPLKFSLTKSAIRHRAPLLDEHRAAILDEWGRES